MLQQCEKDYEAIKQHNMDLQGTFKSGKETKFLKNR